MIWIGLILGAYLLGSIPFGLLIGLSKGVDIREHGSKNIGATNVGRTLGRRFGVICFFLDAAKGSTSVVTAGLLTGIWGSAAGSENMSQAELWLWLAVVAAALLGHMYSPWLGFKGGKGVATGFGGLIAIWPALTVPAAIAMAVWFITLAAGRYISVASVVAAASLPVSSAVVAMMNDNGPGGHVPILVTTVALALFVAFKHRSNLQRLRAGTEPKIGSAGSSPPGE